MDTSVFAVDLSTWLSWTSSILYAATFFLALFVVVLIGCMVRESMTPLGQSATPKKGAPSSLF
jgi:hypothetical protein